MSKQYTSDVQLPHNSDYVLRCLEANLVSSQNTGAPMLVNKWEIVSPVTVEIAGEEYSIAGTQVTSRNVLKSIDKSTGAVNEQKTLTCEKFVFKSDIADRPAFYQALGYDVDALDRNNPPLDYVGKQVYAELKAPITEKRKTPTKAQLDRNEPGDIMVNPVTRKPMSNYYPEIVQIFGVVPSGAAFGG